MNKRKLGSRATALGWNEDSWGPLPKKRVTLPMVGCEPLNHHCRHFEQCKEVGQGPCSVAWLGQN